MVITAAITDCCSVVNKDFVGNPKQSTMYFNFTTFFIAVKMYQDSKSTWMHVHVKLAQFSINT